MDRISLNDRFGQLLRFNAVRPAPFCKSGVLDGSEGDAGERLELIMLEIGEGRFGIQRPCRIAYSNVELSSLGAGQKRWLR